MKTFLCSDGYEHEYLTIRADSALEAAKKAAMQIYSGLSAVNQEPTTCHISVWSPAKQLTAIYTLDVIAKIEVRLVAKETER